ncbi:MAG: HAD-IIIA family hydrolase [Deltaproteobacteria bacterium]|nr:HAD-IIIA family hydrolase [Deltaproteobacteria bacterium]
MGSHINEKLKKIKILLLDVDGVMTDGSITIDNKGVESKSFHVRDGHGIKLLQRAGVKVGIITGRDSKVVLHRAAELGIEIIYQGIKVKMEAFTRILENEKVSAQEVAYVGDDVVDLPVLREAGFSVAVADASHVILSHVDYVTKKCGGRGAVREVTDLILEGKGLWSEVMGRYF